MAKFCTKCGKELKEGQTCDCQKKGNSETKTVTVNIDVKESCMDCVNVVKGIFTKPVETIKDFVCDSKLISAIIMIVVAALSSGLYHVAYEKAIIASDYYKPKYMNEFFTTFADSLVKYALIAALGYVLISLIFKGKTTWKQMVAAVGASVSVLIVGYLLNSILVFIDAEIVAYFRGYISYFAEVLSILIIYKAIEEKAELDKNKLLLGTTALFVLVQAGMDIYNKIFK